MLNPSSPPIRSVSGSDTAVSVPCLASAGTITEPAFDELLLMGGAQRKPRGRCACCSPRCAPGMARHFLLEAADWATAEQCPGHGLRRR
jgi:hypothetical protein